MGGCCGGDEDHGNVTISKSTKTGGNKTGGANVYGEEVSSDNIFDHTNEKVKAIYENLGDFKVRDLSDGVKTVEKPMAVLENNAKYMGHWREDTGQRHGFGV